VRWGPLRSGRAPPGPLGGGGGGGGGGNAMDSAGKGAKLGDRFAKKTRSDVYNSDNRIKMIRSKS